MKANRLFLASAMVCGVFAALPCPARADAIDDELAKVTGARKILKHLRDQGYRNVGVLRFSVQKGDAKPSFHAGYLNDLMATRLENALIVVQPLDEAKLVGITRGATRVAVKEDPKSSYLSEAGRAKLFSQEYPLAWGVKSVKVDAFVTGKIQFSKDMKTTHVVIETFSAKDPANVVKIAELTPSTDRATLRDIGASFVVTKRSMFLFAAKGLIPEATVDGEVPSIVAAAGDNLEKIKDYLEIEILTDWKIAGPKVVGTTLPIESDGAGNGKIDGPAPGKTIAIRMKAKAQIGVLLRVNGLNTLNEERYEKSSPYEYSWWVLEPGRDYYVRGFAKKDAKGKATLRDFVVKTPEEATPTEMGEDVARWGKIEFEIFADMPALGLEPRVKLVKEKTDFLRREHPPVDTFEKAKELISMARSETVSTERNLILPGLEAKDITLESTEFNGTNVARLEIRYYYPGK